MRNFELNYRKSYYVLRPWELVSELVSNVKWVVQRGRRGYADCDVWSLDAYLVSWLPEALDQLKRENHGHPVGMTAKGWNVRLDIMKRGFLAARRMEDIPSMKEYKQLERTLNKGLKMFSQHFLSLWD